MIRLDNLCHFYYNQWLVVTAILGKVRSYDIDTRGKWPG